MTRLWQSLEIFNREVSSKIKAYSDTTLDLSQKAEKR